MGRIKRIWYLSPMRAAKVQASLRIRAVSPEPPLLAHTSSESRGTFKQKARSLAPLNGWACAVKICHDGMLEDTNSLDGAQMEQCKLRMFMSSNAPRVTTVKMLISSFRDTCQVLNARRTLETKVRQLYTFQPSIAGEHQGGSSIHNALPVQ